MRKVWFGILATALIALFVAPAFAWEFNMEGQFEWRYRYFGRANGYQDLFGDMRFQDNPFMFAGATGVGPIGFAGQNLWRGFNGNINLPMQTGDAGGNTGSGFTGQLRIVRGGNSYADCDAAESDQRMTFLPEIRVNNAIRLRANVDLAGIRQKYNHRDFQTNGPLDRWYQDRISQNAYDTAMLPSINQYWATAQLPWGILVLGSRDFAWGTGAVLGLNTRNDSLLGVFPYGPFRIIPQIWLAYTNLPLNGFGAFTPYGPNPSFPVTDPAKNHSGPAPNTVVSMDKGNQMPIFWSIVATYENGPVNLGFGFAQFLSHFSQASLGGPQLYPVLYNPNAPSTANAGAVYSYGGMDEAVVAWTFYLKYNNGRFFTNLEYWFANVDLFHTPVGFATGSNGTAGAAYTGAPPLYIEANMAYAEVGALCGPAKISGLWAWSGGSALNNPNPTKSYTGIPIDWTATDAYNYLMFKNYAGGNDAPWAGGVTFTSDDYGMMLDAWCLAARLDYAVAANLNVWGSYMWANRVEENGWLAGQKDYNGNPAIGASNPYGIWTAQDAVLWKQTMMPGAGGNMNPYVDSCYLGWEADCGFDWKLLENLMVSSRYAYWQPGTWFDQAYQVVGVGNNTGGAATMAFPISGTPGPGIMGGFLQGRSAIQSFTTSIFIDF